MEARSEERARRAARAAESAAGLAPARAVEVLGAAIADVGPLPALAAPLADALEALGRDAERMELCLGVLARGIDPREAPAWNLRLAHASEQCGDASAAIAAYRAVLAAAPRERRALAALQRIHRERGERAALVRALEGELALCAGAEEIALRLELATLLEPDAERAAEALSHLRRVIDLDPSRDAVIERARALAERLCSAECEVAILDVALARRLPAADRGRLLARQAALLAGPLSSPVRAVSRWREALASDPRIAGVHEPLRCALERLGDWSAVLEVLYDEACSAGPDARRVLLERGALTAAARFGDAAALPWLERLRAAHPDDPSPLDRIADLRRQAIPGDEPHESASSAAATARAHRAPAPVGLESRAALDPSLAGNSELRPGTSTPLPPCPEDETACADPAREAARAEAELATLDRDESVYTERCRSLVRRLARLYAGPLDHPERALDCLRAVVDECDPTPDLERDWAETRLIELLRSEGNFFELEARLSARLERRPEAADAWLELARLREERLLSPSRATDAYREALRRGADRRVSTLGLRRTARALGDFEQVAATIETELESETRREKRASLFRELGEVAWHRLGATTRASRAFAAALESDPSDRVSLRSLRNLLASMEDWRGALDLVESEIELLPLEERRGRRELFVEAAALAETRLGDHERAIRALEAADRIAPLSVCERRRLADCLYASGSLARYVTIAESILGEPPGDDPEEFLRIGRACLDLARPDAARSHAKRAVLAAPSSDAAWELLAEAERSRGHPEEAATCLVRAAEIGRASVAVSRLLRAADVAEPSDAVLAHAIRERACSVDPGNAAAWLARARSAQDLGRLEEAEKTSLRAVELATSSPGAVDAAELRRTALAAVGSASGAGRKREAIALLRALSTLEPDDAGVLRALVPLLREAADVRGALEAASSLLRLGARPEKDPELALALAEALAAERRFEEAAVHFESATRADPSLDAAWRGLAESLEACGDDRRSLETLDAWASARPRGRRSGCLVRAAELVLRAGDETDAELRLRAVLAEDARCTRASSSLARLLVDSGRPAEALAAVERAKECDLGASRSLDLERLHAIALERLGRSAEACDAWARVLAIDPRSTEATRARAALLRSRGAWQAAARTLEWFVSECDPSPAEGAVQVWLELAELRALPLADRRGAVQACRAALRASPGDHKAREALADALGSEVSTHGEAVIRHLEILEATPQRLRSIEALVAIADSRGDAQAANAGRAILDALGKEALDRWPRFEISVTARSLCNPVWEAARRLASTLAPELAKALRASPRLDATEVDEGPAGFRLAAVAAEARLAAAALVPLDDVAVLEVLRAASTLAEERALVSGNAGLVNELADVLGRKARRRAREALGGVSADEIAEIDPRGWRAAIRGLAHAAALDATGGDLRSALRALVEDDTAEGREAATGEGALVTRIGHCVAAGELLRRCVEALGRRLLRERSER